MVNTGKPSGACATCKARRIKCDETRPYCLRCRATRRQCPGFVQKELFPFRNETSAVKQRVDRKRLKAEKRAMVSNFGDTADLNSFSLIDTDQESNWSKSDGSTSQSDPSTPLPNLDHRLPDVSIHDAAVAFYFQNVSPGRQDSSNPGSYVLSHREIFGGSLSSSPIYHVTLALALAVFGKYSGRPQLRNQSMFSYGLALQSLGSNLYDRDAANSDEIILAALGLCFYEAQTSFSLQSYHGHLRGMSLLISNRGASQFRNRRSLGIFRAVRHHLMLQCIHDCLFMEDIWVGDELPESDDPDRTPLSELDRIAARIPALQQRTRWLESVGTDAEDGNAIMADAFALDEAALNLFQQYHSFGDSSSKVSDLPFLNMYRMFRIRIQSVITRCLAATATSFEDFCQDERHLNAIKTCQALADAICTSSAIIFEKASQTTLELARETIIKRTQIAQHMIWPMWVVCGLEIVSSAQRARLKSMIRVAKDKFGLTHAAFMGLKYEEPSILYGERGPKYPLERLAFVSAIGPKLLEFHRGMPELRSDATSFGEY